MATPGVQRRVQRTPAEVFEVLADGWLYPLWVVGASRMRAVDAGWPSVGARLHHSFGVWPMLIDDETTLLDWQPSRRVVLQAKGWPMGEATVTLTAQPDGADGALLEMVEDVSRGPGRLLPKQLRQPLILKRNTETLRRLALLVEGRQRG